MQGDTDRKRAVVLTSACSCRSERDVGTINTEDVIKAVEWMGVCAVMTRDCTRTGGQGTLSVINASRGKEKKPRKRKSQSSSS